VVQPELAAHIGDPFSRSYYEGKLPLTLYLEPVLTCFPQAQYTLNAGTKDDVRHIWYLVRGGVATPPHATHPTV
jgi:hypothetical protein